MTSHFGTLLASQVEGKLEKHFSNLLAPEQGYQ